MAFELKTKPSEILTKMGNDLNLSITMQLAIVIWLNANDVHVLTTEDLHAFGDEARKTAFVPTQ